MALLWYNPFGKFTVWEIPPTLGVHALLVVFPRAKINIDIRCVTCVLTACDGAKETGFAMNVQHCSRDAGYHRMAWVDMLEISNNANRAGVGDAAKGLREGALLRGAPAAGRCALRRGLGGKFARVHLLAHLIGHDEAQDRHQLVRHAVRLEHFDGVRVAQLAIGLVASKADNQVAPCLRLRPTAASAPKEQ